MTTLEAMRALSGTDSKRIADQLNKEVGDHRGIIGRLRNTAGVDAGALENYASQVDRLSRLTEIARSETSPLGELGSTISSTEKSMLSGALGDVHKAATQDFKVKLEDTTTVAGAAKAAGDPAKTTTDTLIRNQGESIRRSAGTGERVGESIDGSTAKSSESRRMTRAEGENVWRDEKTGKPVVDVSSAAVKRAEAEPVGGKDAKATTTDGTYKEGATTEQVLKSGKTLAQGDGGQGVTDAQKLLSGIKGSDGKPKYDLGTFGDKGDGIDGKLGPKTRDAIEQFKKDQGFATDGKGTLNKEVLERLQAVNGAAALDPPVAAAATTAKPAATTGTTVKEGADTRAARLGASDIPGVASRLKDAFASGSSGRVNELMGQMNGDELKAVREQIGTKKFEEMISGIRKQGLNGYDTDYGEALQASAFGDRRAIKDGDVAGFTQQLKQADTAPNIFAQGLKAIGLGGAGTNEEQMNKLFELDGASLKKVDAELRKSYPGGLREFINSNYGSADDSHKTRDLFMKRFNAAGI